MIMKELEYPFDSMYLLKNKKKLRKQLLEGNNWIEKRIAVLGGSTTHDIIGILELFLLNSGIKPSFYESEYAQYWQDAMFANNELLEFKPELIFIHTTSRNINNFPTLANSKKEINNLLDTQYKHFEEMWIKLKAVYNCPIIQNNFEYPNYRLLGNKDFSDSHGRVNFVSRLNAKFVEYAENTPNFYINDINYLAADFGLKKWSDPQFWYMYKYALSFEAIPVLAFSVFNIIKSILGKNKKAMAIDLDNTLWGGIVGDDGVENLQIGQETALGESYCEFQQYLKNIKNLGVLLNIISKNDKENALAGLKHPQMILKEEDFISIKANWEPKDMNLSEMASELNLLPESFVFVDDNPAEREIIKQNLPNVAVPELSTIENYITEIDKAGYFEQTSVLSVDDVKRNEMYKENIKRIEFQKQFSNYNDYLVSLNMSAEIKPFEKIYYSRISQLTNKSNQFNLTTRRYTLNDIENFANNEKYITLLGTLSDKFGDNGVVSLVIAEKDKDKLDIILWLMSCRVLKRDMEYAMMDALFGKASKSGIKEIKGYYFPTAKNKMVADFYEKQGFTKISDNNGNTEWLLKINESYQRKNKVIKANVL